MKKLVAVIVLASYCCITSAMEQQFPVSPADAIANDIHDIGRQICALNFHIKAAAQLSDIVGVNMPLLEQVCTYKAFRAYFENWMHELSQCPRDLDTIQIRLWDFFDKCHPAVPEEQVDGLAATDRGSSTNQISEGALTVCCASDFALKIRETLRSFDILASRIYAANKQSEKDKYLPVKAPTWYELISENEASAAQLSIGVYLLSKLARRLARRNCLPSQSRECPF